MAYIPGRGTSIFGKDYTNGSLTYVCLSAVSTTNWQYLQSLLVRIPVSNPSEKAYSVVENAKKWEMACPFYTQGHNSLIFVDALNQGWWSHLKASQSVTFGQFKCIYYISMSYNWRQCVQPSSLQILHKRILIASDNTTVFGYLNKQKGGGGGHMYLLVWRILAYCNPWNILKRDRHIVGCLSIRAYILFRRDKGLAHPGLLQSLKYTHRRYLIWVA